MKTFLQLSALSVFAAYGISGCGEDFLQEKEKTETIRADEKGSDDAEGEPVQRKPAFDNPDKTAPVDSFFNDMLGLWQSECTSSSEQTDKQIRFLFDGQHWGQADLTYLTGYNCQDEYLIAESIISGTIDYSGFVEDQEIIEWDGALSSYSRRFFSTSLIDYSNEVALHGYTDWQLGEAKECIDKPDPNGTRLPPQTLYGIAKVVDSGEIWLEIGEAKPENRPAAFGERVIVLQPRT